MSVISRTVTLLWVIVICQCTFLLSEARPFNPKKHTTTPFKHHRLGHKNAIMHPLKSSSSAKHLALGSFKPTKAITPFHFSPTQNRGTASHHKPSLGALKTDSRLEAAGTGGTFDAPFAAAAGVPSREQPTPSSQSRPKNGFEIWGEHVGTGPAKELLSGSANTPGSTSLDAAAEDTPVGKFVPSQPLRHKAAAEPSRAIYLVPGQPPRIVEESFADGDFGTLLSSEGDQGGESESDGWFMSLPPYPEPYAEQDPSSSSDFAGIWGAFLEKKA